jgi:hypothetical protein
MRDPSASAIVLSESFDSMSVTPARATISGGFRGATRQVTSAVAAITSTNDANEIAPERFCVGFEITDH